MPNLSGTNNVRNSLDLSDPTQQISVTKTKFYEQRKQLIYQLKSEHYIPKPQLKIELNASYTNGSSSAPDFTDITYTKNPDNTNYQIGGTIGNGLHRYFRYLKDDLFDSRLTGELPIGNSAIAGPRKIKFGVAYQYNKQKRDLYDYSIQANPPMYSDDVNQVFTLNNFAISNGSIPISYLESGSPANHTFGYSSIKSGFLMTDYSIIKKLRFAGGLRVEQANIFTDVFKFDSLHYEKNDPRRTYQSGVPLINPGSLNNISYLPSGSLIYKVKDDDAAPINVRFNYSQTVARPSIRELSDLAVYDYFFRAQILGNSDLKPARVKNYDVRFEWYFKNRDNFSVSFFYKDIRDHIEIINSGFYTYINADKSTVSGLELDGKKSITKYFDLMSNITLVKSNTQFYVPQITFPGGVREYRATYFVSRPMFGQANYIINGIVAFNAPEKIGLTATLSYNRQGPRLAIASDRKEIPDVYEMPRNQFDFKVIKKLGKYFNVTFTIRDILNTPIRRTYLYADGTQIDFDKFRYGTNYVLGVSYKL
jgi:outer membrane receptor protein involved in Fe transport